MYEDYNDVIWSTAGSAMGSTSWASLKEENKARPLRTRNSLWYKEMVIICTSYLRNGKDVVFGNG